MKDRVLLEDGILRTIHGGNRFAQYLDIDPTGYYGSIAVPVGEMPLAEMKRGLTCMLLAFLIFRWMILPGILAVRSVWHS